MPSERPGTVWGMGLRILERAEMPEPVQLDTPEGFRMYAAAWTKDQGISVLRLEVNEDELSAIDALNFGDEIFARGVLQERDGALPLIDHLPLHSALGVLTDGHDYNPYLNNRDGMLEFARELQTRFIGVSPERVLRGIER